MTVFPKFSENCCAESLLLVKAIILFPLCIELYQAPRILSRTKNGIISIVKME